MHPTPTPAPDSPAAAIHRLDLVQNWRADHLDARSRRSSSTLVEPAEPCDHLRLLSAFRHLKQTVIAANEAGNGLFATDDLPQYSAKADPCSAGESLASSATTSGGDSSPPPQPISLHGAPATQLSSSHAWNVFLTRAPHRFELYIAHVASSALDQSKTHDFQHLNLPCFLPATDKKTPIFDLQEPGLPPIDVAMIWRNVETIRSNLRTKALEDVPARVDSLMRFYVSANPLCKAASIDLVAAVHRQMRFFEEMDSLSWLDAAHIIHAASDAKDDTPEWDSSALSFLAAHCCATTAGLSETRTMTG